MFLAALFPTARAGRFLLAAGLVFALFSAKLGLLDRYGSDLPYWDQWDGEGEFLYAPYLENRLTLPVLFRPHNEHRPVATRLWSIALLEIGGRHWDNRVQAIANIALHAATALLLLGLAWRILPPWPAAGFAGAIAWFFGSAVSWQNTLVGFQSQFYFLLLFSALHLGGTLLARAGSWSWRLAPAAGLAAIFSVASGVTSALACLAAVLARVLRDRKLHRDDAYPLVCNGALVVVGFFARADMPAHAALKATGVASWFDAWLHQFAWPIAALWAAPLGLIPPGLLVLAWFRRRLDGPVAWMLVGAIGWCALQTAAIAYGRGGVEHGYASRYCDLLSVTVLVNWLGLAWLAVTAPTRRARLAWHIGLAALLVVGTWGLVRQAREARATSLASVPAENESRIAAVRSYVRTHDPAFFNKVPGTELPYPSAQHLARLLDRPSLRAILPSSVRPPIALQIATGAPGSIGFQPLAATWPAPAALPAWISETGEAARFTSTMFELETARIGVLVAGDFEAGKQLRLVSESGATYAPLAPLALDPRWQQVTFAPQPGRYRLEAARTGPGWFAFSAPVAISRASYFAQLLPPLASWFAIASAFCAGAWIALQVRAANAAGAAGSARGQS